MNSIAAVVITKNEERNIEACLATLTWADEIIIVDAESQDRTVELASKCTEAVYVQPWAGFGPQKNFGIDKAQADWILIVDADERVSLELREEIQAVLAGEYSSDLVGYDIPRRNYFYDRWIRFGGIYPDFQLRLFKKEAGRYNTTLIHENLILRGRTGRLRGHLDHYTIPTIKAHISKMFLYTTLAAQEKARYVKTVGSAKIAGSHVATIFRTYVLRGGWRDGVPGLIIALFAGLYTFLKYAKLYEMLERGASETCASYANRN